MDPERHSRAQELFEQAEALPPEQRETFLRATCADDPTLRREVDGLLEAAAGMTEDFLEPPRVPRPKQIRAGETLTHYRILEPLGAGGMGEVYLAEDSRLKRRVALKVLPPELAGNPERLKRFQREAETVAALNHPNIVTIHSIENASGLQFLTMELVDGPSLRQLIGHSGALPIEDVLNLGVQISEGLAEAHAAGIVHRDLKPANVMVAPNDRVKLLDFGLARPERPLGGGATPADPQASLTKAGAILGTVGYMSPEQLTGQRVDSRSDVFSLGILLFELATGRHPFPAETEASTLAKILEREPEDLLDKRPGLPRELERIVGRCLEKNPDKRYQDTAQLVRELEALRRTESGKGSPADTLLSVQRISGPHRRAVLAAATLVTVALGAFGLWRWTTTREREPQPVASETLSVAVLPLRNISEDPEESDYVAEGIGQAVTTKLTQAGLRVAPWESVRRASTDLPPTEVAKELGVAAVLVGTFQLDDDRIRTTLSLVEAASGFQAWAQDFDEPFDDLFTIQNQIALKAAERLKGRLTPEEQKTLASPQSTSIDAYDNYLQGAHYLQAEDRDSTLTAIQYFEEALRLDPDLVEAHIGLGAAHNSFYDYAWGGLDSLLASEGSHLAALRLQPASMGARRGLMRIEFERGRSEEVLIQAREARRAGHPNDVESLLAEAEGYCIGGLIDLSVPIFRRALELDPLNNPAYWGLVTCSTFDGQFDTAVRAGETHSSRFPDNRWLNMMLGVASYSLGRIDEADRRYQQAIADSPDNRAAPFALLFRGHLLHEKGRQDEALSTWRVGLEAIQSRRQVVADNARLLFLGAAFETCLYGAPSPEALREAFDPTTLNSFDAYIFAAALARQGDWQRSAELLQQALDRGSVTPAWMAWFRGFGRDPDAPQLAEFRQAYQAKRSELEERFGPADPLEPESAR